MSLQDFFMKRAAQDHQNALNSDTTGVVLGSLVQGVLNGIQQKQEEIKLKNKEDRKFEKDLILVREKNKSSSGDKYINTLKTKAIQGGRRIISEAGTPLNKQELEEQVRLEAVEKENIANKKIEMALKKSDLEEKRLQKQLGTQDRLQVQQNMNFLNDVGKTFNPEDSIDVESMRQLGLDYNKMMEGGLAKRNEDGSVFIEPKKERDRLLEEKTVPQTVATSIDEFKDSKDILRDVMATYKDLNLDLNTKDRGLVKQLFSEAGILSVSQRSNLLRQFRDPKVASLYSKLERAFQKYRVKTTGAQASDKELRTLRPLIARLVDEPEVFKQTIADLEKELDQAVSNRLATQRAMQRDSNIINSLERNYFGENYQPVTENNFATEEAAIQANLPPGTPIIINGRRAVIE